jgi:hypothetical protein
MSMEESLRLKRYGLSELLKELPIPLAIIVAEELREGVEEALAKLRKPISTYVVEHKMLSLIGSKTLLDLVGRGTLRELLIISDSPNLLVMVEADGRPIINHRLSELMEVTELLENIDVFERNGTHVLRISSVYFLNKLRNVLVSPITTTVRRYFAIYDIES